MFTTPQIKTVNENLYRKFGKEWKRVIKVKCQICGNHIYRKPWLVDKIKPTCSYKCIGLYNQAQIKDKDMEIFNLKDTKNFNYLLGLLTTDGYIYDKYNKWHCSIGLNNKDKYILEKIKSIFGGRLIRHSETATKWMLHNKPFVKWLIDIGITNKKSLTVDVSRYFNTLSLDNKNAFMRGVIDGDGFISKYCFGISSGSIVFLEMCKKFFKAGTISRGSGCYNLTINKEAYRCLKPLYNICDKDLHLSRKRLKYKIIEERKA